MSNGRYRSDSWRRPRHTSLPTHPRPRETQCPDRRQISTRRYTNQQLPSFRLRPHLRPDPIQLRLTESTHRTSVPI